MTRPAAPFVIGAGRSGTTLLRMMLDAHPQLAIPSETRFVPRLIVECRRSGATPGSVANLLAGQRNWADFGVDADDVARRLALAPELTPAAGVRAFFGSYAARFGKERWGDKTPSYFRRMPMIGRAVPEARFIHLIRDVRDVAVSWQRFRRERGDDPATPRHWAELWAATMVEARAKATAVQHYVEVRYEDLVTEPEETLRSVCAFLELPFADEMLSYHLHASARLAELAGGLPAGEHQPARSAEDRIRPHQLLNQPPQEDRIGAWRETLGPAEVREVEEVAGELLTEAGYQPAIGNFSR